MQNRYVLFKRRRVFYCEDSDTGKQESLRTRDRIEAQKLIAAKNDAANPSYLNRALGRTYLSGQDPKLVTRKWSEVIEKMIHNANRESTRHRNTRAFASSEFNLIREKVLCETTADDFLAVLQSGKPGVNHFLRRLHNLAIKYGWLAWPVLPSIAWPKVKLKSRRGITRQEHEKIVVTETQQEWRLFFELLWEVGASQTDAALLTSENIDWEEHVLYYRRKKLSIDSEPAILSIGTNLEKLLRRLPDNGPLFPTLYHFRESVRSWHFAKLCRRAGVSGVSLHSYRYSWAERAAVAGYPERWARAALGHKSRAIHQAYARKARIKCPSLEIYEEKISQGNEFTSSIRS